MLQLCAVLRTLVFDQLEKGQIGKRTWYFQCAHVIKFPIWNKKFNRSSENRTETNDTSIESVGKDRERERKNTINERIYWQWIVPLRMLQYAIKIDAIYAIQRCWCPSNLFCLTFIIELTIMPSIAHHCFFFLTLYRLLPITWNLKTLDRFSRKKNREEIPLFLNLFGKNFAWTIDTINIDREIRKEREVTGTLKHKIR